MTRRVWSSFRISLILVVAVLLIAQASAPGGSSGTPTVPVPTAGGSSTVEKNAAMAVCGPNPMTFIQRESPVVCDPAGYNYAPLIAIAARREAAALAAARLPISRESGRVHGDYQFLQASQEERTGRIRRVLRNDRVPHPAAKLPQAVAGAHHGDDVEVHFESGRSRHRLHAVRALITS